MEANQRDGLREVSAQIGRAAELMVHAPADYESFEACLETAVAELRRHTGVNRLSAPDPTEIMRLRAELDRLSRLFRRAESFYRGWCSLAGVSDTDAAMPRICVRA